MKKGVVIDLCDEDDDLLIVGGNDGYEEDDDALFNFSGVTNLSREAGYSPASRTPFAAAASPPSSPPRSSRVSNFDQDDYDEDLSLLRRSVPEGSLARAPSASAPAPSKQVSAVAPVNESSKQKKKKAGAEPPAKKKKGRTDLERLADLEARCHQDVLREEFIGGMEAGNFLRENVVLNESESASGCLVFVCKSTGVESQHVLRLMSGLELLKMLREEVRAAGKRDWVDAIETMDAFVETLKDAHQGRQLSVIVFEMDQGFKDTVRQGIFPDLSSAKAAFERAAARLQARFCCNVSRYKTLREAGVAAAKIGKAIASHMDDATDNRPNNGQHGAMFTVEASRAKKTSDRRELWTMMLMTIPGVSRAVASAVVSAFPTLQELLARYKDPSLTERQKKDLLADIMVEKKKLGPKKSERIYTIFTTQDGSLIIKGGEK